MKFISYALIGIVLMLTVAAAGQPIISNSSVWSKDVQDYVNSVVTTPKTLLVDDVLLNISVGEGESIRNGLTVELSAKYSFTHPFHSYVAKKSDYSIVTKKSKEMKYAPGCGCDDCYCIRGVDVENSYFNLRIPLAELSDFDNTVKEVKANVYNFTDFSSYSETFTNPYYDQRVGDAIDWYCNDAWVEWVDNGSALLKAGKYDEALEYFNKSIAASDSGKNASQLIYGIIGDEAWDHNVAQVWANKGHALEALGRTTEAEAAFAKAKELYGNSGW